MMSNPLATPSAEQVERGVAVVTAEDNRWHRCDLKTISLVGNVLMRQLAADADAVETVMFRDGYLTEASASNVLVVTKGTIVAPPKDELILPGITYGAAWEFAQEAGIPIEMRPVTRAEALAADEMWLTSSTKEVIAITTLDGRPFAGGKPGPFFRKMHALFQTQQLQDAEPLRLREDAEPVRDEVEGIWRESQDTAASAHRHNYITTPAYSDSHEDRNHVPRRRGGRCDRPESRHPHRSAGTCRQR